MKDTNNWEKDLQEAKAYCLQVNGLPHCKNCGVDFDGLIANIKGELATQKAELEKKHKEEMKKLTTSLCEYFKPSHYYWVSGKQLEEELNEILEKYGLN